MTDTAKVAKNPETEFKKGVEFLESMEYKNAEDYFKNAYNINPDKPKYLSYYGLSIALAGGNPRVGIELCNRAINMDCMNSDFYLNLGKIYALTKHRKEAIMTLKHGLSLNKDNTNIIKELDRIGLRAKSVLPFLSRNNYLNIHLGRVKSFLERL